MNMRIPSGARPSDASDALEQRTDFALSPDVLPGTMRILDIVAIAAAGISAAALIDGAASAGHQIACVVAVSFMHLFLGNRAQLFEIPAIMRPLRRADDLVVSVATGLMLLLSVAFALEASDRFPPNWIGIFFILAGTYVVALRCFAERVLRGLSRRKIIGNSMVVLGIGEQGVRFLRRHRSSNPYFTEIIGVFDASVSGTERLPAVVEGHPVLGGIDDLLRAARTRKIDDVVVALPWNADQHVAEKVGQLKELPVNVYLSTDLIGFELAFRPVLGRLTNLPLFEVVQRPISGWSSALKAAADYVLATAILIITAPLLAFIAIAIKLDSRGPVLFRQARLGFNNRVFYIYKFRSMYQSPQSETAVRQATRHDPRITRVGRFIRATSLDELPQLFNVLDGTMSLVGPRPHAISHNEEYSRHIRGYFARHKVKPGITGWAQVNGLRGETDTLDKMEARIQHDIYYTENWSIFFDMKILFMTVLKVLFQKNAY